jgi:phage-related protein
MAINTFTFGGITSSDFGIYVSGEGLFNAPKRAAEVVSIPGRNGDLILDQGKFENIKVTYRVFNQEKDLTDFRTKLANLRSALASQVGYQKLEDTFHPSEYRLAAFIEGVEIEPIKYNTASEFEITFECKPQRFLVSGETQISVTSGDTITNPTLFEAQPLLEIEGYGNIDLNGYGIEIENVPVGDVILDGFNSALPYSVSFGDVYIKSGDAIDVSYPVANIRARNSTSKSITNASVTNTDGYITSATINGITSKTFTIHVLATDPLTFSYGTSAKKIASVFVRLTRTGGSTSDLTFRYIVSYDGNKTITFTAEVKSNNYVYVDRATGSSDEIVLHSTELAFGHPTYIDCEIGEAYAIDNGVVSPLNKYIALGSELPALSVGANTVTYDNTITSFKVTPRWWQV